MDPRPFLLAIPPLGALLGHWLTGLVPAEHVHVKRYLPYAAGVLCVPLFFLLAWWQALILTALLLFGQWPAFLALAYLESMPQLALVQWATLHGIVLGGRWRSEQRPRGRFIAAVLGSLAIALFLISIR